MTVVLVVIQQKPLMIFCLKVILHTYIHTYTHTYIHTRHCRVTGTWFLHRRSGDPVLRGIFSKNVHGVCSGLLEGSYALHKIFKKLIFALWGRTIHTLWGPKVTLVLLCGDFSCTQTLWGPLTVRLIKR